MKYQTHENFLPADLFKKIKDLIMDKDFPWRRRDHMVISNNDPIYFTYNFYNDMTVSSEWYTPCIVPIFKKLKATAPVEARANIFISTLFKRSTWHRDWPLECKTAILYLNTCDGGTELKINDKIISIKAQENKMLIFDTPILHRAVTSSDEPIRYIINFNYYEGDFGTNAPMRGPEKGYE